MFTINKKNITVMILMAVAFLVLSLAAGIISSRQKNNVYRILVKDKNEASLLSSFLSGNFDIISGYNSTVSVNLFGEKKNIFVNDIDSELNEQDPRRTYYVNNIDSLFFSESGDYEIIYLFTDISPLRFYLFHSREISEICTDWLCPEIEFDHVLFQLISIIIFLIVFTVIFRKFSVSFLLFLPWLSVFFAWRYDLICISFCIIYLFAFLSDLVLKIYSDERRIFLRGLFRKTPSSSFFLISVIVLNILFILFSGKAVSVLTVLSSMGYDFLVIAVFFVLRVNALKNNKVNIFRYKSIIGNEKLFIFSRKKTGDVIIIVMICILFFLLPSVKNNSGPNIPFFGIMNNSWPAVSRLNNERQENLKTVQISDYIKHVIYQEYYQYGITEFLPEIDEEISVSHFIMDQGQVKKEKEILFIFTDSYYSDILHSLPVNSAARIFTNGAVINRISYLPVSNGMIFFFNWWQYLITVIFTVIPIIIFYYNIKPVYLSRVFIVFTRRNRQSA